VIMDACYSGGIVKDRPLGGVRVETMSLEEVAKQRGAVFLLSSKPDEISQEKPTGGGWFTHYLIEGLKGEAGKGKEFITTKDLYQYVAQAVSKQTYGKQNPLIIGTKEIIVTVNLKEQQRKLVHELVDLALDGKIPEDYIYRYVKVLTQSESKDSDLEKKIRAILQKYANDKNLEALKLQTKILLGDGDGSTPPPPPPGKGTCLLKIIAENDLAKTAKIFLDNVEKGDLSKGIFELIDLAMRKYILVIDGEKIERYEKEIQFTHEYEVQEIKFTASVPTRPVRIQTEPTGAKVFIDGKEVGISTWQGKLEVGKMYEIKLIKEGYRDEVRKIHIPTKGELITIEVRFSEKLNIPVLLSKPTPLDGQSDVFTKDVTFKWQSSSASATFDVYLGTEKSNLLLVVSKLKKPEFTISKLNYNTLYYWKVIASNEYGEKTEGPIWSFKTRPSPGTVKWKLSIGEVTGTPAISDMTLYVPAKEAIYAIDTNGNIKWKIQTGSTFQTPAVSYDGTVYVGNFDGNLYAITPDGKISWKYYVGAPVNHVGIDSFGNVYFGSDDYCFYAVTSDGRLKWNYKTKWYVRSSPSIGPDNTVYIGSDDSIVYAFTPDGRLKWSFKAGLNVFSSPIVVSKDIIYFGCADSYVYALNSEGKLIWKIKTTADIPSSPAIGEDGTIYIGNQSGDIYAIFPNGETKWRVKTGRDIWSSPAVGKDGTIYICSDHLYAINPAGEIIWKVLVSKKWTPTPTLDLNGMLYVGAEEGLYAIYTDSYGLADSPWPKFRGNLRNTGRFGDK